MTFEVTDTCYRINVFDSERVIQEFHSLETAHKEMVDFIIQSAKQMADFVTGLYNGDPYQSSVLRTPSRRTSKRKRSSVAVMTVKTRDVSAATPRRLSKRTRASKRVTLKLDDSIQEIQMEVDEVVAIPETAEPAVAELCLDQPLVMPSTDAVDNASAEPTVVQQEVQQLFDAQELMSELSIKDDKSSKSIQEVFVEEPKEEQKLNESDNDWMTDDEDGSSKKSEEVTEPETKSEAETSTTTANTSNRSVVSSSAAKAKRKKSMYYTPQTTLRSTRAQTRMLSRIADSSKKTPQNYTTTSRLRDSSATRSDQKNKALTASALKRRQEAEEERRQRLLASQEKEKLAIERRRLLLQQKVEEKKMKSEEKAQRAALLREQQRQLEAQRLKKEWIKKDETQKKREVDRLEQIKKRQEELAQKSKDMEKRRQMQELNNAMALMKKQEELEKKQEQERERQKEQDRVAQMISQHNNSLQQKAMANSFLKKKEVVVSSSNLNPKDLKVTVIKMSASETAKHMARVSPTVEAESQPPAQAANSTFVVKEETNEVSTYDMTPPPKEYDNYDISALQSDEDTDDDDYPHKQVPNWAKGQRFTNSVHEQFKNKSTRKLQAEADRLFGNNSALLTRFATDFDRIFPTKSLPKYYKRTSSAVWDESPLNYSSIWEESSLIDPSMIG